MTSKKKARWGAGSVFAIPLPDGSFGFGQVVDLMWQNVVYCAFTDRRESAASLSRPLETKDTVSLLAVSREQLDYRAWTVIEKQALIAERGEFANERFASASFIGAKIYDASVAEEFLCAFHALAPWDDWYDPKYLDGLLISIRKKPTHLRYKADVRAI